jgi:Spy/CpxP family protein refolding chaperone
MKRSLTVLAMAALAGVGAARAQTPPPPGARPDSAATSSARAPDPSPLLQALLKDITLTTSQQRKVDSIRQSYLSRVPPQALTAPDSAMVQQVRGLLAQALEGIRGVLDPHQKNVWDRNVATEMSSRMRVGP